MAEHSGAKAPNVSVLHDYRMKAGEFVQTKKMTLLR